MLGCEVPDEPYPIGNDGGQLRTRLSAFEAERNAKAAKPPAA